MQMELCNLVAEELPKQLTNQLFLEVPAPTKTFTSSSSSSSHSSMAFWDLFFVALVPILETLLVTLLGSLIATQRFNLLRGVDARNYLNNLVFYLFLPALLIAKLAETITFDRLIEMWFMFVNIFLTFVVGSILGWMLNKIARTPKHLKGLVNASCTAGNLGNLLLIIVPAVCGESSSPFGDSSTCSTYGEAYAAISTGVSTVFIWTYLYILMGASVVERSTENLNTNIDNTTDIIRSTSCPTYITQPLLLPSINFMSSGNLPIQDDSPFTRNNNNNKKVSILDYFIWPIRKCMGYIKLEMVFTPSTIAVIIGFAIGAISPIQKLMVGDSAPLRVIIASASLVGEGAIVSMTLIVGANLLDGLKRSGISYSIIIGIMIVRFILSPILGIFIVKAAYYWGFVGSYSLYQFVLMLQYALPPATTIGTMVQLLGVAEGECSLIMIWTYIVSTITLTLWSTFFMWMLV